MKTYIANHYVKVNGIIYMKGEPIPEITEDKAEWLLSAGAITEVKSEAQQNEEESVEEEMPEDAYCDEDPEETAEDPEEIDVMSGIVAGDEPEQKPKRARKRG